MHAVESRGSVSASSIQLLSLESLKQHFGDNWEGVSGVINRIVTGTIERSLHRGDTFTCFKGDVYVIVFTKLSADSARVKTAIIAQEINRRIFGDVAGSSLLKVGSAKISKNEIAKAPLQDPAAVLEAVVEEVVKPENCIDLTPLHVDKPEEDGNASIGGHSEPTVEAKIAMTAQSDEPDVVELAKGIRYVYLPTWFVKRDIIIGYACTPARIRSNGRLYFGGAAMPSSHESPNNVVLDPFALEKVARDLATVAGVGSATKVTLPVHLHSISHARFRDRFSAVAVSMPQEVREQLIFELMGIAHGTPGTVLAEAVSMLRPLCSDIVLRTRLEGPALAEAQSMNIGVVGVDLANMNMSGSALRRSLDAFNLEADKRHIRTFAHGVFTKKLLDQCTASGFWYLDGLAVDTAVMTPNRSREWTEDDTYLDILPGAIGVRSV